MYKITDKEIECEVEIIPNDLLVLKGTMAFHHMVTKGNAPFFQ